jgi:hypothetical protein
MIRNAGYEIRDAGYGIRDVLLEDAFIKIFNAIFNNQ